MLRRRAWIVAAGAVALLAGGALYGFQSLEAFLIRDARFALGRPGAAAEESLRITGVRHASPRAIEEVFAEDRGHSIYLIPLEARREALRQVPWVRDAAIARIWPNRLLVQITEREPVAFVTLSRSRFALIDAEGEILPPTQDHYDVPVLSGIRAADDAAKRKEAVQRLLRVMEELGAEAMREISEVDVSQPANIAIIRPYQGRMVRLLLGDRGYGRRYQNFVQHFADVEARVPGAKIVDLRLEDRITVAETE
jgi:cell division protein FtsQ